MSYTINKSFLQSRRSRNCFDQVIKVDSEDPIYTTLASTLSVIILVPFYMAALVCFLSPVGYLDGRFSLYTATSGDGFTMYMGFLGSCTRSSDNQPFDCTKFSLSSPFGDFSVKINPALGQANVLLAFCPLIAIPLLSVFVIWYTMLIIQLLSANSIDYYYSARRFFSHIGIMGCLLGFLSYIIALVVYFNGIKQFNDPEQVDISVSRSGFIVGMFAYLFITLVVLHEYYMVKLCKRNRESH